MTDEYGLREAGNVAWLKAKRDCTTLIKDENEEFLRMLFLLGFAAGSLHGSESTNQMFHEVLDKHVGK